MPKLKVYNGWTLDEALTLIRQYQYGFHSLKFHVALGGGVLNNGTSIHDLDLYVLPFDNEKETKSIIPLIKSIFEHRESLLEPHYTSNVFRHKDIYEYHGKRIDIFIV